MGNSLVRKGVSIMEKDHNVEFKKMMRSICSWNVNHGKAKPPKSELPECIKERVRWVIKISKEAPVTFIGSIAFAFPDPDDEWKIKKEFEFGETDWLPISDEYKKYWKEYFNYRSVLEEAVAVALIYGLNDDSEGDA